MIPLNLKIKGLYSYREEVEIDFVKLAENNLFGIFGPVGSGKSAILEAMTYALYGNTSRLDTTNRSYNMMNLQSQEMLIVFEFKTATNEGENRYQFRVRHTRNSKRFEEVRSPARTASIWKGGVWEPLPSTDAEPILKLSYENFIKTIIIPQGKFQEFMHMGETPRTRMLRELFGLDRFELSQPTGQLIKETEAALSVLQGQLMSLSEANPDEIAAKEGELKVLALALENEQARYKLLETAVARLRQLQKLAEERASIQQKLESLLSQKEEWEKKEAMALQYQKVVLDFRELVNRQSQLQREVESAQKAVDEATTALDQLLPQLSEARLACSRARSEWEGRSEYEAKIKDCEHLQAIRKAADSLDVLEDRLKKGEATLATVAQSIEEKRKAKEAAEAKVADLKRSMPNLGSIEEALRWYQQRKHLQTQLDGLQTQQAALVMDRDALFNHQAQLAAETLGPNSKGEGLSEALESALEEQRQTIHSARVDKEQIVQREGLAAFALELVPGSPCPLCGATDHPAAYHPGEASEKIKAAEARVHSLETQMSVLEKTLSSARILATRLEEKEKQIQGQQAEKARVEESMVRHLKEFAWPQYDPADPSKAEAERLEAKKIQSTIEESESQRVLLDQELDLLQKNQEKYHAALVGFRDQKSQLIGQRDTHLNQRTLLVAAADLERSIDEISELATRLNAALERIDQAFRTTQEAEKVLEMKRVEFEQKQIASRSQWMSLSDQWNQNEALIQAKLAGSSFSNLSEVKALLAMRLDLEAEQRAIADFKQRLQSAESALSILTLQAENEHYDPSAHAETESAVIASKLQIDAQTESQSLLREAQKRMKEELEQRKALEAKQETQRRRLENLKILERMFMGSGFVKYVSTKYLQELVARADARFRVLTRNALSLEIGADNDFLVRDMLNGGQTRSVKTLSGGQTFQASLCLALALADNVQQMSGSHHNFFFLDEGFGTLDRESLAVVFETLKQLRLENRIVGVISHVDEMQQEIEVFLRVFQTEEKGSQVVASWE